MNCFDIVAWTQDGEIYCEDCFIIEDDNPEQNPVFGDAEFDTRMHCGACGTELDVSHCFTYPTPALIDAGPLSSDTMNPAHLIPVFVTELQRLHGWSECPDREDDTCRAIREGVEWQTETLHYGEFDADYETWTNQVLDALFDALDEIAGAQGFSFGAHESDGACYGFWYIHADDCDDTSGECEGECMREGEGEGEGEGRARALNELRELIDACDSSPAQWWYTAGAEGEGEGAHLPGCVIDHSGACEFGLEAACEFCGEVGCERDCAAYGKCAECVRSNGPHYTGECAH